jgi:hypothetical protein
MQLITSELNNLDLYVIGDMNINYSYPNNFNNSKWVHIVQDFCLEQLIQSPTSVTKDTSIIIDHLYVSSLNHIYDVSVSNLYLSDHYPLSFTINCVTRREANAFWHKTKNYRSFKNFNEQVFKNDLNAINFDMIETIAKLNNSLDVLYNMVEALFNKHAPVKVKRIKGTKQPDWYSDEIKEAHNKRDHYKSCKDLINYKLWRNKCQAIMKKSKKMFYNKAVKESRDCKYLWQNLKDISNL